MTTLRFTQTGKARSGAHARLSVSAIALFAALSASTQVRAQEVTDNSDSAGDSGTIIVTATRRAQSTIDVPLAISAIGGQTLESANISTIRELSKLEPSLATQDYGPTAQRLIIRGISSYNAATVGLYLGEIPLLGPQHHDLPGDGTPSLRLHDLERVEILKGPQGTLFGAGSMSGTLRVMPRRPDLKEASANVEGSVASVKGGKALFDGNAVFNVPIVNDVLGLRVLVWGEEGGGYIDQQLSFNPHQENTASEPGPHTTPPGIVLKDVNDQHTKGIRSSLLFRPNDTLSLLASYTYQDIKVDGIQWISGNASGPNPYLAVSPVQAPIRQRYYLASVEGTYSLPFADLTAAYSHGKNNNDGGNDSTGQSYFFGLNTLTYVGALLDQSTDSAELRLSSTIPGPFKFVVGGYYQEEKTHFENTAVIADAATGFPPCARQPDCAALGLNTPETNIVEFAVDDYTHVKQYAFYGQVDYDILENLTATAGIRYFHGKQSLSELLTQDIGDFFFGVITTPRSNGSLSTSNSKTTYNFALLYKPTSHASIYARAASGFRLGGVNIVKVLAEQQGVTIPAGYEPDSLWSYELGAKTDLFDNQLSLEASIYRIDWNNQQVAANAAGAFAYIANVGKSKVDGFEVSAWLRPSRGLTLGLSGTYTNARLAADLPPEAEAGGTPGFKGNRLPLTPKWIASASLDYTRGLTDTVDGYINASISYRGKTANAYSTLDPYYRTLPEFASIDLSIGAKFGAVDMGLFAQNLTNVKGQIGNFSNIDADRVYIIRPRTLGIKGRFDF